MLNQVREKIIDRWNKVNKKGKEEGISPLFFADYLFFSVFSTYSMPLPYLHP